MIEDRRSVDRNPNAGKIGVCAQCGAALTEDHYRTVHLISLLAELAEAREAMKTWELGALEDKATIDRLKARLEAAELVCNTLGEMVVVCNHKPDGWDVTDKAFKAWRKAAGK